MGVLSEVAEWPSGEVRRGGMGRGAIGSPSLWEGSRAGNGPEMAAKAVRNSVAAVRQKNDMEPPRKLVPVVRCGTAADW